MGLLTLTMCTVGIKGAILFLLLACILNIWVALTEVNRLVCSIKDSIIMVSTCPVTSKAYHRHRILLTITTLNTTPKMVAGDRTIHLPARSSIWMRSTTIPTCMVHTMRVHTAIMFTKAHLNNIIKCLHCIVVHIICNILCTHSRTQFTNLVALANSKPRKPRCKRAIAVVKSRPLLAATPQPDNRIDLQI